MLNPYIAGWRIDRAPGLDEYPFRAAPDWVCEVLSPTTERHLRATKLPVFASYGTTHVWLVDPDERVLEVFRLSDAKGLGCFGARGSSDGQRNRGRSNRLKQAVAGTVG
jgi:hypothetical protein